MKLTNKLRFSVKVTYGFMKHRHCSKLSKWRKTNYIFSLIIRCRTKQYLVNRSYGVLNTSTVPLNTSTVSLNTSTVPLNTSTVPLKTSTVPLNTSTVPLNTSTVPLKTFKPWESNTVQRWVSGCPGCLEVLIKKMQRFLLHSRFQIPSLPIN